MPDELLGKEAGARCRSYCCYSGCTALAVWELHRPGQPTPPRVECCEAHLEALRCPKDLLRKKP